MLQLANSEDLWERRIAIIATWYFIRKEDLDWTFNIAYLLINDKHDLINKAVGWMLREAGKRNERALIEFLEKHVLKMPRTMLRYAIEKLNHSSEKNIY
ncbi:MAG: DNA alkylation repair protein [Candidatus Midichloria sp.]|nr:DNA alkylation repair protein [Candidatus Midichloria sp.]